MWHSAEISISYQTCPIPFTREDLDRLGISRYALTKKPRYRTIFRGVWIDKHSESKVMVPSWGDAHWLDQWQNLVGLQLVCPEAVASHATAAVLYGLPLPKRLRTRTVHVSTVDERVRITRKGVVQHINAWRTVEPTSVFDTVAVSAGQVFFDLAKALTLNELVQLGDALVGKQLGGPYTTIDALKSSFAARKGTRLPGRKKIEKALKLMRPTVESPMETWLRLWIRDHGFPEPEVHPAVQTTLVHEPLHPDLGYPDLMIAIEYEGDHHRTSDRQFNRDIQRIQHLEAEGWLVLRVTKRTDMDAFAGLLAKAIASRSTAAAAR